MEGKKIVITSDRSLFSTHRESFYFGFASVLPTKVIPSFLQYWIFCPPPPTNLDGSAKYAIVALRCVESAFVENGIAEDDIAVVHPSNIHKFIGKRTEFVCVSAQDPLGIGPVTSTWASLMGGIPFNRIEFERLLMKDIARFKEKYDFKLVVGGPGSWQLSSEGVLDRFNIDALAVGEVETLIPKIIAFPRQRVITAPPTEPHEVPPIKQPTVGGLVEITRGCGLGCTYCTPTLSGRLRSLPLDKITSDVKVNVQKGGNRTVTMQSDNALNYGSKTYLPDEDALMNLYSTLFSVAGVKRANITHTCLAPFAYMPEFIQRLTKVLREHGHRYYVCQPGLETASPKLMKKLMPNKCFPYTTDEWPSVVREAFKVLDENRWVSATTIMMGLPGEEREDIIQTLELVRLLDRYNKIFFVPIFFNPITITTLGDRDKFISDKMTEENWRLLALCWKHNLRVGKQLYQVTSSEQHSLFTKTTIRLGIQMLMSIFPIAAEMFFRKREKNCTISTQFKAAPNMH